MRGRKKSVAECWVRTEYSVLPVQQPGEVTVTKAQRDLMIHGTSRRLPQYQGALHWLSSSKNFVRMQSLKCLCIFG